MRNVHVQTTINKYIITIKIICTRTQHKLIRSVGARGTIVGQLHVHVSPRRRVSCSHCSVLLWRELQLLPNHLCSHRQSPITLYLKSRKVCDAQCPPLLILEAGAPVNHINQLDCRVDDTQIPRKYFCATKTKTMKQSP